MIDAATATGQTTSISMSFTDDSTTNWVSDLGVLFSVGSTQYEYGTTVCSGWRSLGSWSSIFDSPSSSSDTCNTMMSSSYSSLSLSAGFTQVCVVNTCSLCKCTDYVTFAGQLQVIGFSTTTALSSATIKSPSCSMPTTAAGQDGCIYFSCLLDGGT
jgi:hypothetical protein